MIAESIGVIYMSLDRVSALNGKLGGDTSDESRIV